MPKNYLLVYSEQLATDIELLCQNIKAPSNTFFQIRKSSSSVYANICEANYEQSREYIRRYIRQLYVISNEIFYDQGFKC